MEDITTQQSLGSYLNYNPRILKADYWQLLRRSNTWSATLGIGESTITPRNIKLYTESIDMVKYKWKSYSTKHWKQYGQKQIKKFSSILVASILCLTPHSEQTTTLFQIISHPDNCNSFLNEHPTLPLLSSIYSLFSNQGNFKKMPAKSSHVCAQNPSWLPILLWVKWKIPNRVLITWDPSKYLTLFSAIPPCHCALVTKRMRQVSSRLGLLWRPLPHLGILFFSYTPKSHSFR